MLRGVELLWLNGGLGEEGGGLHDVIDFEQRNKNKHKRS